MGPCKVCVEKSDQIREILRPFQLDHVEPVGGARRTARDGPPIHTAESTDDDCRIIGEFITDELEVRRRSAEPAPNDEEATEIAAADNARLALIRIRQVTIDQDRFRRGLLCIRDCELVGSDFGDYVQAVCEDLLAGAEVECSKCGTTAHDGECVSAE